MKLDSREQLARFYKYMTSCPIQPPYYRTHCGAAGPISLSGKTAKGHGYYRAPFFYEGDKDPDAYGVSAVMIIDRRSSAALPRIHRPFAN